MIFHPSSDVSLAVSLAESSCWISFHRVFHFDHSLCALAPGLCCHPRIFLAFSLAWASLWASFTFAFVLVALSSLSLSFPASVALLSYALAVSMPSLPRNFIILPLMIASSLVSATSFQGAFARAIIILLSSVATAMMISLFLSWVFLWTSF